MGIIFHPHARERMSERGATDQEVVATVEAGEMFPAKYGRKGFRRNFSFHGIWQGKKCSTKQVEAYVVKKKEDWVVVTVITKFF